MSAPGHTDAETRPPTDCILVTKNAAQPPRPAALLRAVCGAKRLTRNVRRCDPLWPQPGRGWDTWGSCEFNPILDFYWVAYWYAWEASSRPLDQKTHGSIWDCCMTLPVLESEKLSCSFRTKGVLEMVTDGDQ